MRKFLLFAFVMLSCGGAYAQLVYASSVKVTSINSFADIGGGDVIMRVSVPHPECSDGFWMTKTDAGFSVNFAQLLSAYHAKSTVTIYGKPSNMWVHSAGKFCRLYSIELT